jgi:hypothetical protein
MARSSKYYFFRYLHLLALLYSKEIFSIPFCIFLPVYIISVMKGLSDVHIMHYDVVFE